MRIPPPLFVVVVPLVLAACSRDGFEVTAEVDSEMPTRVVLSWTTDQPGLSWVEFGAEGLETTTTPVSTVESEQHQHFLLGLPPYTDLWYRAFTQVDGGEISAEGEITNGGLPPELPDLEVTVNEPDLQADFDYLVATSFGVVSCLIAIDREGQVLWYQLTDDEEMPVEIEFEREGSGFYFNTFSSDYTQDNGYLHYLDFTGQAQDSVRTELAHHAFTQLPGGALAWLALDVREWTAPEGETTDVVGDSIQVLDSDGEEHTIFSTWDWLVPTVTAHWEDNFYGLGKDWAHANALRWEEDTGTLLLSMRNLNTVAEFEFDEDSLELTPLRQFDSVPGGALVPDDELYQVMSSSTQFEYLHDPTFTADGTFMAQVHVGDETHAVEYEVIDETRTLAEVWSYGEGEGLETNFLGMARDLDNGNRLVTFSSAGIVREVTPDGEIAWELQGAAGALFGNTLPFSDFYAP